MEDRLKRLKKSMDRTVFANLQFTEQHQQEVRRKMHEREEDVVLAVLQLLMQEKTGYELAGLLRGRGIRTFEDQEGLLYTVLHRLEQARYLQSYWGESGAKYYRLNGKGRRMLQRAEKQKAKNVIALNEWLEG